MYNLIYYYQLGIGDEPGAIAQVQTNDGPWHAEEKWPAEDTQWEVISLDNTETTGNLVSSNADASFIVPSFEEDVVISA